MPTLGHMELYSERDVWVGDISLEKITINNVLKLRINELILRKGEEVRYWE